MFQVPDQTALAELFDYHIAEARPEDGFWCYEITDSREIKLLFSFNTFERSVQTAVFFRNELIQLTSSEGGEILSIDDRGSAPEPYRRGMKYLRAQFENHQVMEAYVSPVIFIRWFSLHP